MYRISKRMEIAGAHSLNLPYASKCKSVHGHNWIVTVIVEWDTVNQHGMVIDFGAIKAVVNKLDHTHLNDIVTQPTAENIAKWIANKVEAEIAASVIDSYLIGAYGLPRVVSVTVQESEGNIACYIP